MAQILAVSPVVDPGEGVQKRRIIISVIRRKDGSPLEYVVQRQQFDEEWNMSLSNGDWFPLFDKNPSDVFPEVWRRFVSRSTYDIEAYPLVDVQLDPLRFRTILGQTIIDTGKG